MTSPIPDIPAILNIEWRIEMAQNCQEMYETKFYHGPSKRYGRAIGFQRENNVEVDFSFCDILRMKK